MTACKEKFYWCEVIAGKHFTKFYQIVSQLCVNTQFGIYSVIDPNFIHTSKPILPQIRI